MAEMLTFLLFFLQLMYILCVVSRSVFLLSVFEWGKAVPNCSFPVQLRCSPCLYYFINVLWVPSYISVRKNCIILYHSSVCVCNKPRVAIDR